MAFVGMDPERIRRVADQLRQSGVRLATINQDVQRLIDQSVGGWEGVDYQDFSGSWNGQHRLTLQTASDGIDLMATSVLEDIAEQEEASGIVPGGPGSVLPPAVTPPTGTPPPSNDSGDDDEYEHPDDAPVKVKGDEKGYGYDEDLGDGKDNQDREVDADYGDGPESRQDRDGDGKPDGEKDDKGNINVELANEEFYDDQVVQVGADGETQLGDVDVAGSVEAELLGANADGTAEIGPDGLLLTATGAATLASVTAQGSAQYGYLKAQASVEATVGAEGEASLRVGPTGAHVGAEAFAGFKARAEGGVDLAGVGASGGAEFRAGIGAGAEFDVGMGDDGKFHLGGNVSAVLGVGGKVDFDITIDPGAVTDFAGDMADAVDDVLPDLPDIDIDRPGWLGG